MPARNLVILCDGTSNEIDSKLSNVLKLFRMASKSDEQRLYYDPGIGTIGDDTPWARMRQKARSAFELATGYGFDKNLVDAYTWLCQNWESEDDRIWLFGYSRGAYTVRALAGLVHMLGIMRPDQANLTGYAVKAYRTMSERGDFEITDHFSKVVGARRATIHFVGVWDTVASIIVPGWRKLLFATLEHLPYTQRNPSVRHFRQALAIDERRRLFRPRIWTDPQAFVENPFNPENSEAQSIQQVWFAGCHGDVGGGHLETQSGLSKYPLIWLVEEAKEKGLDIHVQSLNRLGRGERYPGDKRTYSEPSAKAPLHRSLQGAWHLLEILPKSQKRREWSAKWTLLGIYFPLGEPRPIPEQSLIHRSVEERMRDLPDYRPVNLPVHRAWVG